MLTVREKEVAELIACGYTDKEIAGRLGISSRTAEKHSQAVKEKLSASNRAETIAELQAAKLFFLVYLMLSYKE